MENQPVYCRIGNRGALVFMAGRIEHDCHRVRWVLRFLYSETWCYGARRKSDSPQLGTNYLECYCTCGFLDGLALY